MNQYYESRTDMVDLQDNPGEATLRDWSHLSDIRNWRITQLPNGYYQSEVVDPFNSQLWHDVTRRSSMEEVESCIHNSVEHYRAKSRKAGEKYIVKTFK